MRSVSMVSLSMASLLVLVTAACGDDNDVRPDAAAIDAAPDAPPNPGGCDYTEQFDSANDDIFGGGTPEATGKSFTSTTVLCGSIDSTHYMADETLVDIDGFAFTVPAEGDVLITLAGAGLETVEAEFEVYGGAGFTTFVTGGRFVGVHAAASMHLPAGDYAIEVIAFNNAAITAPLPYKVKIVTDAPAARCAELTTGGFAEAGDGGNNAGNDVVLINRSVQPTQTLTAGNDMPEATGIMVAPTMSYRLTGTSAAVAQAGSYFDKDTFAFTTDATTNQVAIRLTWPSTTVDLDYHLFEQDVLPFAHRSIASSLMQDEFKTLAVKPSTTYWLWIGADLQSTALPATYTATVCGGAFTP